MDPIWIALAVIIVLTIALIVAANKIADQESDKQTALADHLAAVAKARKDAVARSHFVQKGQAAEHVAPWKIAHLNTKDYRFMGNPIDFLVCDGATEINHKISDEIRRVYLLDIKTGKSQLNKTQRRIRDAVAAGRVSFATYNPDTDEWRQWDATLPEDTTDA